VNANARTGIVVLKLKSAAANVAASVLIRTVARVINAAVVNVEGKYLTANVVKNQAVVLDPSAVVNVQTSLAATEPKIAAANVAVNAIRTVAREINVAAANVLKNQAVALVDQNAVVNVLINPAVMDPKNVAANAAASVLIRTVARVTNVAVVNVMGT